MFTVCKFFFLKPEIICSKYLTENPGTNWDNLDILHFITKKQQCNGKPNPLFQSLMLRQQCSPPQESPSSQDSSFLNLIPWRKIFSRFQSSTTLAVLFVYVCIIYIQSGKMTLTFLHIHFISNFAGFYVQKRFVTKNFHKMPVVRLWFTNWNMFWFILRFSEHQRR